MPRAARITGKDALRVLVRDPKTARPFPRSTRNRCWSPSRSRCSAVPATPDWADLFGAPLDDEPFTEEEQAAADRAPERFLRGDHVLLDDVIAECERAET